jgi:hypothetical protein
VTLQHALVTHEDGLNQLQTEVARDGGGLCDPGRVSRAQRAQVLRGCTTSTEARVCMKQSESGGSERHYHSSQVCECMCVCLCTHLEKVDAALRGAGVHNAVPGPKGQL